MNKLFYPSLAWQNIRKNSKFYFPYILTVAFTSASFYIMFALGDTEMVPDSQRYAYLTLFIFIGVAVITLFSVIFLFYTNSFLMKRRNKEIALYNILGMGKRHIAKVFAFESLYTALFGIGGGILTGIVFQMLVTAMLCKMMNFDIHFDFYVSVSGIIICAAVFCAILLLNLIFNLFRIHLANPIELLYAGSAGEKEPKTKWILTFLGIAALGFGYYIAVTTKNSIDALSLYFVAVFLVIIGTYCLFTAVSIFVLKMLKKNKKFYYKTKNFIGISGMLHRMKRNAVGLANICILSTMVLVMVSGTLSLFWGTEDAIKSQYPSETVATAHYDIDSDNPFNPAVAEQYISECAENSGLHIESMKSFEMLSFTCGRKEDIFIMDRENSVLGFGLMEFITAEEYTELTGSKVKGLKDNQILLYTNSDSDYDSIVIDCKNSNNPDGEKYSFDVVRMLEENPVYSSNYLMDTYCMVVSDRDVLLDLYNEQKMSYGEDASNLLWSSFVDYSEEDDVPNEFPTDDELWNEKYSEKCYYERFGIINRSSVTEDFYAMNGGFFFLGVFLGILFIMAAVLIIYYKQISEGYEDRERYVILKKVGMDEADVKRSINLQILTVFFMPLLVAVIHLVFNFKMVTLLLALFGLVNTAITFWCTAATVGAFVIVYGLVYILTARAYYKIVT